ncbi:hypothetical protein G4B88_011108 [Cannabis sativa]|uniref:Uncharacterized protein n=1 Tax=Cannabis sativa TaxID=3483 RepID=A0A7J6DL81_CANSA|nr:hypothetical protein G4B88_011108 [Cannabis sativa]
MSLIAGSYERFIWGFKLKPLKQSSDGKTLTLTPLFSYPSHVSSITTVAAAGPAAASGGSDDTIHLYDFAAASSLGSLNDHTATITSLSFFTPPSISFPRNLISAASDGTVCIYDADPLSSLRRLRSIRRESTTSPCPSGRLALTVGRDECLGMLNLLRGRRSFFCRMGREASMVGFDSTGDKFFMVMDDKISIHETEDARIVSELENQKGFSALPPASGLLFTGGEDRSIVAWDTNSGKVAYNIEDAHSSRVKGIVVLTRNAGAVADDDPYLIASASSDGVIRVWDVRMAVNEKPNPLAEANTNSRITCLAGSSLKSTKRLRLGSSVPGGENDGVATEDMT